MDFKCVRVISQMILMSLRLQEEAEARNHLSLRNQTVIVITCGVFFCVPDLLINLLHLFLTQRISGGLLLIKKKQKKKSKRKDLKNLPPSQKKNSFWFQELIIQTKILSIFWNVLINFFTRNNSVFLNFLRDFSYWTCQEETFFVPSFQFCQSKVDPANHMLAERSNQY